MVKQDEHGRWYVVGSIKKYARRAQAVAYEDALKNKVVNVPTEKVGLLRRLYGRFMVK